MRRILFILLIACLVQTVSAQPERRREQQKQAQKSNKDNLPRAPRYHSHGE